VTDPAPDAEITTTAGDADGAPAAADGVAAKIAALEAENARMAANLDRLREAEKSERAKRQEAQEEARAKMEAEGRYQALAEDLKERLAQIETEKAEAARKLAEVSPVVERYTAWEAKQSERVDAALQNGIPEYLKTAIRATPDVASKAEILDAYMAEQAGKPGKPASPTTGARAAVSGGTVPELLSQGMTQAEIRLKHPEVYAAFLRDDLSTSQRPGGSMFDAVMGRMKR